MLEKNVDFIKQSYTRLSDDVNTGQAAGLLK